MMEKLDSDAFVRFIVAQRVLKFGTFTLKSGRASPYFFNLGEIATGAGLKALGEWYARRIVDSGIEFDVLYGPAYKGIPIATATAVALSGFGRDVGVVYNRKEHKTHGEGGLLVGAATGGRVLVIDDVLTSGKAVREALATMLQASPADRVEVAGVVVALDRREVAAGAANDASAQTAVQLLAAELAAPVLSIVALEDVIKFLDAGAPGVRILAHAAQGTPQADQTAAKTPPEAVMDHSRTASLLRDYQSQYCVLPDG